MTRARRLSWRRRGGTIPRMAETRDVSELIDRTLPDLTLASTQGDFPLRAHVGRSAQVLFFYIRNGTGT